MARKFNIRRRSDKKVVIVIKSDKKLLWDVFNIEKPEWSVECGVSWHVVRQLSCKRHESVPHQSGRVTLVLRDYFGSRADYLRRFKINVVVPPRDPLGLMIFSSSFEIEKKRFWSTPPPVGNVAASGRTV